MQASYVLLVRPRRMGKSLFVNTLMAYYDVAKADRFQEFFSNLYIGEHPTAEANKYLVLKFDFSHIKYDTTELEKNFGSYCINCIDNFLEYYSEYFTEKDKEKILNQQNVKDTVVNLVARCRMKGLETYLFIDEYDNFSNTVLSARGVKAHAHGEGFYRDFFKACKGTFTRVFMTGVIPVTYDDLTSGFNIADVVALKPTFDRVIGVTETELRDMLDYYRSNGRVTLSNVNDYYAIWPELELGNGYCDVLLVPKGAPRCSTKYSYLLEIKYMKAGETDIEVNVAKACHQLDRYEADKHLADSPLLRGTPLTKLYLVFQGQRLLTTGLHD